GGREAFFERGGIDERLEARPGLAQRLRDVIVLGAVEIEAADERAYRPVARVHRDERGLDRGQLGYLPAVLLVLLQPDDRAAPDALVGRRFFPQHARRELESFLADLHPFPAL